MNDQIADQLISEAMLYLSSQPKVLFIGQNVEYDGNVMYKHLEGIPLAQRLELPVCEELQMGMSIGLALEGFLPISIYPRFDFLMLAMNQLVNHLDKLPIMTQGEFQPKVIIRTKVGSRYPLNAGPQHTQDYTEAMVCLLKTIAVRRISSCSEITGIYNAAVARQGSTLIIEALE